MYNQHVADYYYHLSEEIYNKETDPINFYKYLNEERSQEPDDWFMEELYEYEMI